LRKFFGEGQQDYVGGVFMVQKEVADKLCQDAHKKSYLWWIINFAYDVIYLKTVPAKAFSPAPKVTSALIELRKKVIANLAYPAYRTGRRQAGEMKQSI